MGEIFENVDVKSTQGTGTGAIATTHTATEDERLYSITCKFSSAPTTSENLTATWNKVAGAAYDVVILSTDPSASSATSVVYIPDESLLLRSGDAIDVAFTNTDGNTYGVEISTKVG